MSSAVPKTIDELIDDFELFDVWEEKYAFIIELGDHLPEMPEDLHDADHLVQGCQSQVWLVAEAGPGDNGQPTVEFVADSDSRITKGLIAILVHLCSGRPAEEIIKMDLEGLFERLDLKAHLSRSRSNGLHSMIKTLKMKATEVLAGHNGTT